MMLKPCLVLFLSLGFAARAADLAAAGATFPAPLYAKWIHSFQTSHPDFHIRYEPTGSEEGIRRLKAAQVDFAASDFPINDADLGEAGRNCWHLPTTVGAVVPIYHIPGFVQDLRLSPEALAGIFLGKITKWNDPLIKKSNPGVKLPANDIVVIHRSDGSGTTYVLSDYLSKVSPDWRSAMGKGSTLQWSTGEAVQGNDGVASAVTRTANSIGYVEFIYGVEHRLPGAAVQNAAGRFMQADIPSVAAAAATAAKVPDDFRVSITNAPGADVYPICSFTWFLVPAGSEDRDKRESLRQFLSWVLSSGQRQAAALGYVSVPKDLLVREQAILLQAQASR